MSLVGIHENQTSILLQPPGELTSVEQQLILILSDVSEVFCPLLALTRLT
jgi:hypothetical protein